MPGNKYAFPRQPALWIPALWIPAMLFSQEPLLSNIPEEDFLYRDESMIVPDDFFERYADLLADPLNLNSASPDALDESGLFTPYQIHNLVRYRKRYGKLYSIFELAALPGFRISGLKKMAPFLTVETGKRENPGKKKPHIIMLNLGKVLPEAAAYKVGSEPGSAPAYKGSPLSTCLRIKSGRGRFSLGLTYEKDAGETFHVARKPEFLSGYLQYKGNRLIKQLVVGNFRLNQGLGVVNGSGFMHAPESFRVSRQSLGKIRPYNSKSEYGYERGAAIRMDLNYLSLLGWFSHRRLDLSTANLEEDTDGIDWSKHLRNTGLHRTEGELEGRDLAFHLHGGLQTLLRYRHLHAGLVFSTQSTGLSSTGTKTLAMSGKAVQTRHLSLHGSWTGKGWQLAGELALSDWESMALLTGIKWETNDFLQGLLLLHHYGGEYRGAHASAYAYGSKISNESGLALHMHLEPGRLINLDVSGELFHFPGPRYLSQVPSYAQRYSVSIRSNGLSRFQWRMKLVRKREQISAPCSEPGLRPLRNQQFCRLDAQITCELRWLWKSRLVVSTFSGSQDPYPAYAAVQQLSFRLLDQLRSTLQFVVFDVKDWPNRIYLYEPGPYYSFNFPSYYGTGQKTILVLTLQIFQKISLAAKAACTSYQHRKFLGSGNDLIPGNKKWSLEMQVRLTY